MRTFIGIVLACGIVSAQKPAGQAEEKLNSLLKEGSVATAAHNAELAIQKFEQARDMVASDRLPDEDLDKVLLELGGAYLNGKRPDEAEKVEPPKDSSGTPVEQCAMSELCSNCAACEAKPSIRLIAGSPGSPGTSRQKVAGMHSSSAE